MLPFVKMILQINLLNVFIFTFFSASAQTFTKITIGPVVNTPGDSRSVNWIDINNDGFQDLMITNGPAGGQDNFLYMNNGAGGFTAVTGDPIVSDHQPSDGATWADQDNDGDMDCFVVNYYDSNNLFYNNIGNGTFLQNNNAIISNDAGYSETASWGDYDNDGLVDLYVCNSSGVKKNFLYHNDGNSNFTKVIAGTPVNDQFESRCVNWTDMDDDGDLNLFVTNESNQNENIYRNDGGGVFAKLTAGVLLNNAGKTMSSTWGDYDNDGDLDVFLANDQANNALFRNDGNFSFIKIISDTVSNSGGNSFSSSWSDIDNDGDIDLFVTNAFWTFNRQVNFLYINNGNNTFTRVSNTAPATDSSWSYGCAFGDYDNDGFEDLAVATVRFNGADETDFLYHNDGNANHWITVKLTGTTTNRSAIGTKIRMKAIINGNPVWQMREISAQTSYCGQNDLRAHFGLGNATLIDSIKVEWLSGLFENYTSVAADQFINITEGQGISGISSLENKYAGKLNIYPNPNSETVSVSVNGYQFITGDLLIIKKSNGDTVCEIKIKENTDKILIDLKRNGILTSGQYFISVLTKGGIYNGKFVKI